MFVMAVLSVFILVAQVGGLPIWPHSWKWGFGPISGDINSLTRRGAKIRSPHDEQSDKTFRHRLWLLATGKSVQY
jgi:hypothetical protein